MANFANPFPGTCGEITKDDMINAIRFDIANEYEAISSYDAQIRATNDSIIKTVLTSIMNEEKVHVGELTRLLEIITNGTEKGYHDDGIQEVNKEINKSSSDEDASESFSATLDRIIK